MLDRCIFLITFGLSMLSISLVACDEAQPHFPIQGEESDHVNANAYDPPLRAEDEYRQADSTLSHTNTLDLGELDQGSIVESDDQDPQGEVDGIVEQESDATLSMGQDSEPPVEDHLGIVIPPNSATFSQWVSPNGEGGFIYQATSRGDRIPNFSYAGYGGGGVPFPNVEVLRELSPMNQGDDTERIQAVIDEVSSLQQDANGMRGVVYLRAGEYRIRGQLLISASGVILRGDGRGRNGTVLRATGLDQRTLIVLAGNGRPREIENTRREISDDYVPVGAQRFRVSDSSGYEVGQRVMIERPSTQEWLDHIGMDDCNTVGTAYDRNDVNDQTCLDIPWQVGERELLFDRMVTAVNGNEITIDAPLTMAIDAEFGGGSIYQFEFSGRISKSGIEKIRGESDFRSDTDEEHSWTFIELKAVEDAWVDQVVGKYFAYATVLVGRWARRVTVQDSRNLDPKSLIDGRRRYSFKIERATQVLVQRCETSEGRHDYVLGQLTVGPNVFLDGLSENAHADVGPHAGWSPGVLFDRITTDHELNVRNRGNLGNNHGWVSANSVVWNSQAREMKIESPPGSQNWCIGCNTRRSGNGIWEYPRQRVWPDSLYLAQLERRLGEEALRAIGAIP